MGTSRSKEAAAAEGNLPLGRCPRCGSRVVEMLDRYACEKSVSDVGACIFKINKAILSQPLDRNQVQRLLTSGKTELLTGFVSKSGRQFPAFLVIDDTGKVSFEFPAKAEQQPAQPPYPTASLLRGARPARILLLDDEPFVTDAMKLMLQFYFKDYTVAECRTGDDGWAAILQQRPDLLITDYGHPGLRLEEMLPRLSRRSASFPIIIASAYVSGLPDLQAQLLSQRGLTIKLLNKPFLAEELRAKVLECLTAIPFVSAPDSGADNSAKDDPISNNRPATDCKPLLAAATQELFQKNAFRITGLPVEATTRQVAKHATNLGQMAELGLEASHQAGLFAIKPPPTLDEVREAVQRLKDPENRLVDELFWFWPCQAGSALPDPALEALASGNGDTALKAWEAAATNPATACAAAHNTALFWHLTAIDSEAKVAPNGSVQNEHEVETPWRTCLSEWGRLVDDDGLWERVATHARRIDDPRLKASFLRSMRATLPLALAKINAELALSHAESGRTALAAMHIRLVRDADQGAPLLEKAAEIVLTPLVGRLRESIRRAKETTQEDPDKGADAVRHLLAHAKHLPDIFDLFYGEQEHSAKEVLDEAATTCIDSLVSYQKNTEDNRAFVDLLQAALPLADAVEVRQRIEKNIEIGKNNLAYEQIQPLYENLKKVIEDPPPILTTRLGFISDAKAKFNRVRAEILPALEELKKKFGVTSDVAKRFSDDVAIALRGLAVQSCERYNDFRTASDILKLCLKLCYDPELKKRLQEDMSAANDLLGEGTCYYCDKNQGVASAKVQVSMYRVTSHDSDGTRYQATKVKVPRCKECRKAHLTPWTKTWRGAVPAAILATLLLPAIFGSWGGSRLQDTIVNGTIGALIGGIVAFFVAEQFTAATCQVKPKYAAYGPEFGYLTALRRLGARPPPKPIEPHHKIGELRFQGWQFGQTPRSTSSAEVVAIRQLVSDCIGALARVVLLVPLRPPWSPNATWIALTAALLIIAAIYTPGPAPAPSPTPPPIPAAAPASFTPATLPSSPATPEKRTYRIPSTVSAELQSTKDQIALEKAKAEDLDTKLAAAKQALVAQRSQVEDLRARLDTLSAQIDRDRIYLDRSSQSDIDDFNAKVNRYNTLLRTVRAENATANEMVDSYNTLLEAAKAQDRVVNQLIDNYNSKLSSYGR